jgi:hypothetical protein
MNELQTKTLERIVRLNDLHLYTVQMISGENEITVPMIYLKCNQNWFEIEPEVESFDGSYIEWTVMKVQEIDPPHKSDIHPLISIALPACGIVKSVEVYKFSVSNPGNPNEIAEYDGCILFRCDSNHGFAISSYEAVTGTLTFCTDTEEINRLISLSTQKAVVV